MSSDYEIPPAALAWHGIPMWDELAKRREMRIKWLLVRALFLLLWIGLIYWVFVAAPIYEVEARPLEVGVDLTFVLAPVLVTATAIERIVEKIFEVVELSWPPMVAYLGHGMRWLKNAEIEVLQARQWLAEVSALYNLRVDDLKADVRQADPNASTAHLVQQIQMKMEEHNALVALAEQRLAAADANLTRLTSHPTYRGYKSVVTMLLGLTLGVVVAAFASIEMFAILGIGHVPPRVDVFVTGLVIGSTAYPVHGIVNVLGETKDAILTRLSGSDKRAGSESPTAAGGT